MPSATHRPRIAVVLPSLPAPSETWVVRHLDLIGSLGYSAVLLVDAMESEVPATIRSRVDAIEFVPPCPLSILGRARFLLRSLMGAGWDARRLLPTLDVRRFGRRVASLQLFRWALAVRALGTVDLIHCHYLFTAEALGGLRCVGVFQTPVVGTAHGYDLLVWPAQQPPSTFPGSLSGVDILTFGSAFMLARFQELGVRGPGLELVPLGVDPARFDDATTRGGPEASVIVLTVARLTPFKAVDAGVRAFAVMAKQCPHARYTIAGDGPEREPLERLVRELGIEERVAFLGLQDEEQLTALYLTSDIFLFPSATSPDGAQEGQGLALLEAQAASLPVVAADSGGVRENLLPGRSGFLVPQRGIEEMASRLIELAQDPRLRREMGRAGRAFVVDSRSLCQWADRLRDIYARAGRRPPAPEPPAVTVPS